MDTLVRWIERLLGRRLADPTRSPSGPAANQSLALREALGDAEYLLAYAAEAGIPIREEVVRPIVVALKGKRTWEDIRDPADLFDALSELSRRVKPVTADLLKTYARKRRRLFWISTFFVFVTLGAVLFLSVITALQGHFSKQIIDNIAEANAVAVTISLDNITVSRSASNGAAGSDARGSMPEIELQRAITALQQFTTATRLIYRNSERLKDILRIVFRYKHVDFSGDSYYRDDPAEPAAMPGPDAEHPRRGAINSGDDALAINKKPLKLCAVDKVNANNRNPAAYELSDCDYLEVSADIGQASLLKISQETVAKIRTYQRVRLYANELLTETQVWIDIFAKFILPLFYSVLGAFAYILRDMSRAKSDIVVEPRYVIPARLAIAGICGIVVGLFGDFAPGDSLSPFAIAFLVGYASDVFFSFLDNVVHAFSRGRAADTAPQTLPPPRTAPRTDPTAPVPPLPANPGEPPPGPHAP